jgi:hypothetical protein
VIFPSDHAGFLGGEYGQTGEPDAFATKLRQVSPRLEKSLQAASVGIAPAA